MKTKVSIFFALILLGASASFASNWGDQYWALQSSKVFNGSVIFTDPDILEPDPYNTDDPQPDTIFYDNGVGYAYMYYPNVTNVFIWSAVRFTPADSFELRSVYLKIANLNNVAARGETKAIQSIGGQPSGNIISGTANLPTPIPNGCFVPANQGWVAVNLPQPYPVFAPMEEFFITYGPAPAGDPNAPYNGQGWWPTIDASSTTARSWLAGAYTPQPVPGTGWQNVTDYDLIIRAGGDYLGDFTDLECVNTFTQGKQFFVAPNSIINLKATVENVGTNDVTTFSIRWLAINAVTNDTAFDFQGDNYGPLNATQIQSYAPTIPWVAEEVGMFNVKSIVTITGDNNLTNNTSYLEQYITTLSGMPYSYAHGTAGTSGNNFMWAVCFNTPQVPAMLDSFAITFNEAGNCTAMVMLNDGVGNVPSTIAWQSINVIPGGGAYTFRPTDLDLTDDMFTLVIFYGGSISTDVSQYTASANDSMMNACWEYGTGGWQKGYSGDWPFTVYLGAPPNPVIVLNDSSFNFGTVAPEDTGWAELIVYNMGGGDDLILENILFAPPVAFGILDFIPNTSIAMGDSAVYTLYFCPPAQNTYNCSMPIYNNAMANALVVQLTGEGYLHVHNNGVGTPVKFELCQNSPNPFNPNTTIEYALPVASDVRLVVYNARGEMVAKLVEDNVAAGYHSADFDGSVLSSGIYFYRLNAGTYTDMKKMLLIK
jgi:hypothetical protein